MRRLAAILMLTITPVIICAVVLGAYLNFGSIRIGYMNIVKSRFDQIALLIDSAAETSLSFGIPLDGQDTLAGLLAREQAEEPLLLSIDILDPSGLVLFSSDPARGGFRDKVPDAARDASADRRVRSIQNDFGVAVGSVVVRADRAALEANLAGVSREIENAAAIAGMIAFAAALIVVAVPLRAVHRHADATTADPGLPPVRPAAIDGAGRAVARPDWALAELEAAHLRLADEIEAFGVRSGGRRTSGPSDDASLTSAG